MFIPGQYGHMLVSKDGSKVVNYDVINDTYSEEYVLPQKDNISKIEVKGKYLVVTQLYYLNIFSMENR